MAGPVTGPADDGHPEAPAVEVGAVEEIRAESTAAEVDGTGPVGPLSTALRRGAAISAASLVYTQLVSLIQVLVIARLLSPEEVGWYTAGTVLAGFLVTFSEGGMRNALIQRDRDLDDAANTVFWATLAVGVGWAAVVVVSTPLISWMFSSRTAGVVAMATAGTIVLHSLTNVPDALMQRRFDFRQRLIVRPGTATAFAVVSIALCALGFGVWGLVIASYASYLTWVGTTWGLARWRPGATGRPSYRIWREMARFSYPVVLGTIVDRGRELFETSIVGSRLTASGLGQYRYGMRLAALPGMAVVEVASYVLFPAFARLAGQTERFKTAFLRSLQVLWCLTLPLAGLIVALGEPAVTVLLGEKWRGAGVMLVALAGQGPGVALCAIGMESIKASGRTRLINWVTASSGLLGIGLLLVLLPLGLTGVGLAVSASSLTAGLTSVLLARSFAGVTLQEITDRLLPPLAVAVVAGVVVGLIERFVGQCDRRGFLLGTSVVLVESLIMFALFLVGLRLVVPAAWRELTSALRAVRPE